MEAIVKDAVSNINIAELFAISEEEIDKLIQEFPSIYAYYGTVLSRAIKEKGKAKFNLGVVEAEVQKMVRENAAATNTKITEKAVDVAVKMSAEYKEAYEEFLEAEEAVNILKGVLAALDKYGDSIYHIARVQLAEMSKELKGGV